MYLQKKTSRRMRCGEWGGQPCGLPQPVQLTYSDLLTKMEYHCILATCLFWPDKGLFPTTKKIEESFCRNCRLQFAVQCPAVINI